MVADADLRQRLASEGPMAAARYTWEACARQHLDFYRCLDNGHASQVCLPDPQL